MDVDDAIEEVDEVDLARAAARALNQTQARGESRDAQTVTVGIEELNMDAYDDEDDGLYLTSFNEIVNISVWTHGRACYFTCNWSCCFFRH